jgi:hypothetical protein
VSQDAVSDPKSEGGRLDEPRLEFPFELLVHRYEATSQPNSLVMHRFVTQQDAAGPQPVQ